MRFGYHHASYAGAGDRPPFEAVLERAARLESGGFDCFTVMDHLWQLPHNGALDEPFFDAYTTLPAVAAATERLELSALVTSVGYRNPALLAKMLATLDHASGGRATLGIGAGWYEAEYDAYGYPYPEPAERIAQLADAVELITTLWTEDSPVTYEGEFFTVEDAILEPKPRQSPRPTLMIGGGGEQLTLRVVAEHADRWNVPMPSPESFERKSAVLDEHCAAVGRDPAAVERTLLTRAVLRDTTEAAHTAYEALFETNGAEAPPRDAFRGLVGTPADAAAIVEEFGELGAEMLMIAVPRNDAGTVDRLIDELLPAFQ